MPRPAGRLASLRFLRPGITSAWSGRA